MRKFRVAVKDVVYAAMTATLNVAIGDRIQLISEHASTTSLARMVLGSTGRGKCYAKAGRETGSLFGW